MSKDKFKGWKTTKVDGHEHTVEQDKGRTSTEDGHAHPVIWRRGKPMIGEAHGHMHMPVQVFGPADA